MRAAAKCIQAGILWHTAIDAASLDLLFSQHAAQLEQTRATQVLHVSATLLTCDICWIGAVLVQALALQMPQHDAAASAFLLASRRCQELQNQITARLTSLQDHAGALHSLASLNESMAEDMLRRQGSLREVCHCGIDCPPSGSIANYIQPLHRTYQASEMPHQCAGRGEADAGQV